MTEVEVRGTEEFIALSARLKATDRTIQREFSAALNRATKPVKDAAKASARRKLPTRGGLGERVANARLSTRNRTSGKTVGLTITATGMQQLERMDKGEVRHPTFGNRAEWVVQKVTPRWFSEPMEAAAPLVRREIGKAMDDVAEKIEGLS